MTRNGLYRFVVAASLAGYIFLGYLLWIGFPDDGHDIQVCLFKKVTGIPCPSCGATHSIVSLIHGDISGAVMENPLGILLASCLLVFPFWILMDWMKKEVRFYKFYLRTEALLRRKYVAIPAIMMLLINWIWNIYKGL